MGERMREMNDRPGTARDPLDARRRSGSLASRACRDTLGALALALALHVGAAAAAPATKKPAPAKTAGALGGAKPAPKPAPKPLAAPVALGASFTSVDLDRIFVGNQAGVLKIYDKDKKTVLFTKDAPGTDMKGVDGTQWAPITDVHRTAIFGALGIGGAETAEVARKLVASYRSVKGQRMTIALLGVIGSTPDPGLGADVAGEIRTFLGGLLASEKDVSVRRQAVLALALCATTDATAANQVVTFMKSSSNAWETFTTRQYFEYHKDRIRSLPEALEIRKGLEASDNPYAPDIVKLLN